jgi:hypothetical protein
MYLNQSWKSIAFCLSVLAFATDLALAAPAKPAPAVVLNATDEELLKRYTMQLQTLSDELTKQLPKIEQTQLDDFQKAAAAVKVAESQLKVAQQAVGQISTAKALVEHAKGKWIGGAEKEIAKAEAALKKATTDKEREAANKELAKWQANKQDGIKALQERQQALDKAKQNEAQLVQAQQAAQAKLTQARAQELAASKALIASANAVIGSDQFDAKLVKSSLLTTATPRGLAEFGQVNAEQQALLEKLLADPALMQQMLVAGGAKFNQYGRAMQIYAAIQAASPSSRTGHLQRLALAVALEHARPIAQNNPADQTNAPATIDPVKRYLHYEQAYTAGELDPAFKDFTTWEYRMVVDCDASDEILAWGRAMLRNYRPDHISNADYGWRYSGLVRTDVSYGSENVKCDLANLHSYQNIIMNGGVCGRRAFFGRFILQAFGIPTWGVTQHKHAAVGHWTPRGWVVNLGAGFEHSWWDKDEAPRSGKDFLLESQAREHTQEYNKVLRARWVSTILGEVPFNDRKSIAGGTWSNIAQHQTMILASTAVTLGPLGQELGEANESKQKQKVEPAKLTDADKKITTAANGTLTIPAVAMQKPSGHHVTTKSYLGGQQLHCADRFQADYQVEVPQAGKYLLVAHVVTVQTGQKFMLAANQTKSAVEIPVPYTTGMWSYTKPVELSLNKGQNTLNVGLVAGSRGVTIKEFLLKPVK